MRIILMHEALCKCSLMNINVHSTVDYIYINISPKPQPKSRLKASKILSPGHGLSKPLYMASHGLGYQQLSSASLRPEAEPLTSLLTFDLTHLQAPLSSLDEITVMWRGTTHDMMWKME